MSSIETKVEIPHYKVLLRELEGITENKKLIGRAMAQAMQYAAKPTKDALVSNVGRVGVKSGNLKRAVAIKAKSYSQSGNAIALVGYIVPGSSSQKTKGKGKDRAYHQGFIEFGTKQRMVKGGIASSYSKGVFAIASMPGGGLKTTGYPKSFFKKGKPGQPLTTGSMPVGGRSGRPPLKDAFGKTKGQINGRLIERTEKVIASLMKALKKAESK